MTFCFFFFFPSLFVLNFTYGFQSSVLMTKTIKSKMQASEIRFLWRIEGISYLTNCVALQFENIRHQTSTESKKDQSIRWFSHVSSIFQKSFTKQALLAKVKKRPVGRARTRWHYYIYDFGWSEGECRYRIVAAYYWAAVPATLKDMSRFGRDKERVWEKGTKSSQWVEHTDEPLWYAINKFIIISKTC